MTTRLLALVFVPLAAITLAVVEDASAFGPPAVGLAAELVAGTSLSAAALAADARRARPRFTAPLAALAGAWLIGGWDSPGAGAAYVPGLLLASAWPVLLAHVALCGPDERSLGRAGRAVLAMGVATSLGLGLASTALEPGCLGCPTDWLRVHADAAASQRVEDAGRVLSAMWIAAAVALGAGRLARWPRARVRVAVPVFVPAAGVLTLFAAGAARWPTETAGLAAVAAGAGWERVRARRATAQLARLIVESPPPGGLRARLAGVLGDPELVLVFAADDWIDSDGRPFALPPARELTPVVAGGRPIAGLVHRPGLVVDDALIREIAATARLALDHERLHAVRRAQLEQLRASRARIVAAADGERRRLERDLHDGAQQTLVTLAIGVRLRRREADSERLRAAEADANAAAAQLRELAHGLFPAVLAEEGLVAALESLADQSPALVCAELDAGPVPAAVGSAAYFVVAEALRGDAMRVTVRTRRTDEHLLLAVSPAAGDTTALEDRVGAVGGTLRVAGATMYAELPCGS